ncbi:MAG TPA: hypothetical protein VFC44_06725 [Candidatus Saccharimonadales bacterium]|nr:hypothetical protein [Candidatus Saccharimonadales bacterium]
MGEDPIPEPKKTQLLLGWNRPALETPVNHSTISGPPADSRLAEKGQVSSSDELEKQKPAVEYQSSAEKLWGLTFEVIAKFNPIIDSGRVAWIWIKKEAVGVRDGWHLFLVLAVLVLIAGIWAGGTYSGLRSKNRPSIQMKPEAVARPLPDKIIPGPEPPQEPLKSFPLAVIMESRKPFETNVQDTGDAASELEKTKAEKMAVADKLVSDARAAWGNNLPVYNYSVEELHTLLTREAIGRKDGIAKTVGYFQCLPPDVDPKIRLTNVAEIQFQAETNMDFKIAITADRADEPHGLAISCNCGSLIIATPHSGSGFSSFYIRVNIPGFKDSDWKSPLDARDFIKHCLKILVAGQLDSVNSTNKTR